MMSVEMNGIKAPLKVVCDSRSVADGVVVVKGKGGVGEENVSTKNWREVRV